jgi:flagellar assembly protein FliH
MPKFKTQQFDVKQEGASGIKPRVMKSSADRSQAVSPFSLPPLQTGRSRAPAAPASFATPGAAGTPAKVPGRAARDPHFRLNSLVRDPRLAEEEERKSLEEKVTRRVAEMAEQARKKASLEGYRDGLAKGREEAFLKFQEESAERLARFESLLAQMEQARGRIFKANERFLVDLVYRIARSVLLRELATDREYLLRLARELVVRVGVRENIRIRLHPEDLATAGSLKEGLEAAIGRLENLSVEASSQVERGGCQVETDWNAMGATLDGQLTAIHEALLGPISEASEAPEVPEAAQEASDSGEQSEPGEPEHA